MAPRTSPAVPAARVVLGAEPALGHAAGPSRPASEHGRSRVRPDRAVPPCARAERGLHPMTLRAVKRVRAVLKDNLNGKGDGQSK